MSLARIEIWVAGHRKALVAAAGAAVSFAVAEGWTSNPYVALAVGVAAAFGVGTVRNGPKPPPVPPRLPGK